LLAAAKPTDAIRQAREILERWNSSDLFERITKTESLNALPRRFDGILKPGSLQQARTSDPLESAPSQDLLVEPEPEIATTMLAESELTASLTAHLIPEPLIDEALIGLSCVRPQRPCAVGEDDGEPDHEPAPHTHISSPAAEGSRTENTEGNSGNGDAGSPSCSPSGQAEWGHSIESRTIETRTIQFENSAEIGSVEDQTAYVEVQPAESPKTEGPADDQDPQAVDLIRTRRASEAFRIKNIAEIPPRWRFGLVKRTQSTACSSASGETPNTDLILYEADNDGIIAIHRQPAVHEHEHAPAAELEVTGNESSDSPEREIPIDAPELTRAPTAPVFDFSQFSHIGVIGMTTVANVRKISGNAPQKPQLSEITQPLLPACVAVVVNDDEPEPELSKPAETANVSELLIAPVPKKIQRSPMRRPLLHRRFQMERPATTSPTGSDTVNRNLRVDQPGGSKDAPAATQENAAITSSVAPETKIVSNSPAPGKRFRIDGPESVDTVTGTDGRRARTQTLPKHRYIDDAHDSAPRGPHFEVTAPRRSNLTSATGQFLAYLGVLGLTIGTAMVIYGHFGGYSEYTPTGWLVTTVAQMLLFLGVINLVSGGIEQNNEDVSRRINTLGEQLIRIEAVTSEVLKGPKISAHRYANPDAEVEESTRETADVDRR